MSFSFWSSSVSRAALAALLVVAPPREQVGEELARLASPRVQEREAAERWLAARLQTENYPELAQAALTGDAEVRQRLARVLSADPRHLSLALLLCAESDRSLAGLGRDALHAGVARFDPNLGASALRGRALERTLRELATRSPPRGLRLDGRLTLEQMVEQLELGAELPVGLTLDARIATRTIRREEELLEGPWDELLAHLARSVGLTLECHGLAAGHGLESGAGGFLRLTSEAQPDQTGADIVCEWMLTLAAAGDPAARERAARNLAASGFTPALEWMDHLVRTTGDRAAREGLLRAAARGRVAPALLESPTLESLLSELDGPADPRATRDLCALARSGCFAPDGSSLAARILAGFEGAPARGRWARLLWFERNACGDPGATERARAQLADGAAPGALRRQALATLAVLAGANPIEVPRSAGLLELFREAQDGVERERVGRALRLCGLEPPAADPALAPADWPLEARLNLLEAWLWNGAPEPAARHLLWLFDHPAGELLARGNALADTLRPWLLRGESELVRAVLQRARTLTPARSAELARLALLLGLVPVEEVPAELARTGSALTGAGSDWALLGALAGYPAPIKGEDALRETLRGALNDALKENRKPADCAALLDALERAARGLYAAGRDATGDDFARSVLGLAQKAPRSLLALHFERQHWPPAPQGVWRDLARELGRFEAPSTL